MYLAREQHDLEAALVLALLLLLDLLLLLLLLLLVLLGGAGLQDGHVRQIHGVNGFGSRSLKVSWK